MTQAKVLILMATYNGRAHLGRQLESILNQKLAEWELWIRDDGSRDGTVDLAEAYAERDPRIKVIIDAERGGSASANFSILLSRAKALSAAPYLALADQDDTWHPDKLATLVDLMANHEQAVRGNSRPCLAFSDMAVVDAAARVINPSYWDMEKVDPAVDTSLRSLLSLNMVPGCSMLLNRALLTATVPVAPGAVMHDWWILLVAKIFGDVVYTRQAEMDYVQHGNNQVGAYNRKCYVSILVFLKSPFGQVRKVRKLHDSLLPQLDGILGLALPAGVRAEIERFLRVRRSGLLTRITNADLFFSSSSIKFLANTLIK